MGSVPKATGAQTSFSLRHLLAQVKMVGYLGEDVLEECDSILRSVGEEERDPCHLDYSLKHLEDPGKQYQVVASESSVFMVKEGIWGTCDDSPPCVRMPTHLLSEGEVEEWALYGFPCHIRAVIIWTRC